MKSFELKTAAAQTSNCLLLYVFLLDCFQLQNILIVSFTDPLYELLSQMVSEESGGRSGDSVSSQLSSIACACLLSLVVGLGDTSKMLSAIAMMLIGSSQQSATIQVRRCVYVLYSVCIN